MACSTAPWRPSRSLPSNPKLGGRPEAYHRALTWQAILPKFTVENRLPIGIQFRLSVVSDSAPRNAERSIWNRASNGRPCANGRALTHGHGCNKGGVGADKHLIF